MFKTNMQKLSVPLIKLLRTTNIPWMITRHVVTQTFIENEDHVSDQLDFQSLVGYIQF